MQQSDSIESRDSHVEKSKKPKSRRPGNTAFRQQRLKAWLPILTPKTVLPLFFIIGLIFAPIGGLLIWASAQVEEIVIDYTDCFTSAPENGFAEIPSSKVSSFFKPSNYTSAEPATWSRNSTIINVTDTFNYTGTFCKLQFEITNDIGPPVLFYYRLTNFYQNHRRYVKSLDMDQLMGEAKDNSSISSGDCDPLRIDSETGKAYYPCGLIANSIFNDTFSNPLKLNDDNTYFMTQNGIAWDSDSSLYQMTEYEPSAVMPPPNWRLRYPDGYNDQTPLPNIQEDEAFHVWMRTAGLPSFSKLALRNNTASMPAGRYQVDIMDNFNVTGFAGTKSILISTRTVMGGKNPFLGISYVVVGGLCIVLGAVFTATHLVKPRKLGDHNYLTWNNVDQNNGGAAAGRNPRPGGSA